MKFATNSLALALSTPFFFNAVLACAPVDHHAIAMHKQLRAKRAAMPQTSTPTPTAAAAAGAATTTAPAVNPATFTAPSDPFATIPIAQIVSGAPTELAAPLATTYAAGAQPPISGAPILPAPTVVVANYPPVNTVPPTDSPQVQEWLKEIQYIDPAILAITPTNDGNPANDSVAAADKSRCWWTDNGCTATTDIVTCPDKGTWGLTFDDGPSPYSPKVLKFLTDHKLTATFFAVGSRIMETWGPTTLQAEYMAGHQIAVHTWSHSIPLTALTNEEVVAELGWSRKIIQDVLGVTPVHMRPPWGDIDNRIRAISLAMGMTPIIWTRNPQTLAQFDTNDWRVAAGQFTGQQSVDSFAQILANATQLSTGFIVLQHDLWQQEVDLSTGYNLQAAINAKFNLMDVNTCQHRKPQDAYRETIEDKSEIPTFASSPNANPTAVLGGTSGGSSSGSGGSNSGSGGSSSGSAGSTTKGGSSGSGAVGLSVSVSMTLIASMVLLGAVSYA